MNIETKLSPELWDAVRVNYEKRNFSGAILDAFYFLSDLLRKKSGAEGDGAALVGQALGGATPKIKLNRLQNESEWNVQKGLEQMLRGFYQAVRNPRSHEKTVDSEEDAQVIIVFVGYIVRQLDQAKSQFSRVDFRKRVLDPDFVPQERYARLLVNEIPVGQRLEVFLDIFRAKAEGRAENLHHFFKVLLDDLNTEDREQVFEVISDELKNADEDASIRLVVACFEGEVWPSIDEAVRLRIENRLVRSIREGRYDKEKDKCISGSLGTWCTKLLPYFSLKQEFINVVGQKLYSKNAQEEDYVFKYIFAHLEILSEKIPSFIEFSICARLKKGVGRFHEAMYLVCPWDRDVWSSELAKAFDEFQGIAEVSINLDEEIPF